MRSRLLTIGACIVVALGGVIAEAFSLPTNPLLWPHAWIVGAIVLGLIFRHQHISRCEGATAQDPAAVTTYAVTIPAKRIAPGDAIRLQLPQELRKVEAPGLLCAAPGRLGFIPSRPTDATKRWESAVDSVSVAGSWVTAVRVHSPHGPVVFMIQLPRGKVASALALYIPLEAT